MAFLSTEGATKLEGELSANAFLHGFTIQSAGQGEEGLQPTAYSAMMKTPPRKFVGIRLNTGANRRSVMSMNQYLAYTTTFGTKNFIVIATGKVVR